MVEEEDMVGDSANPPEEVFESWGGSSPSAGPRLEYFGG